MIKLIICIDDRNGMMFNKRRQSKDRVVVEKIKEIIGENKLNIASYSKSLFPDANVVENFADCEGFCFIENPALIIPENIKEIYIFKWNRYYPSDKKFSMDISSFEKTFTEDFAGYSHENITLEKYEKN